ncbi:beta-ketoacyl synthase N-terminal-like domain-containing protein [Streptomyces broussonetiae]|uniref:Beta-ketoacyl synthase n=1 Tax=Streptomyces broussonetiae TaxID=2686304 RepID=A0A6I6N561_9ACTN|nr:beta-ketoacyl synthase N-terminal-like domain-containing protein [Streptomyces broussonetiae]QHA06594.1 beta-ketoacyl synthase [Streptomyces broussonetiae]
MPAAITGSSMVTCLGDLEATYLALLEGRSGVAPLRLGDPDKLGVTHGYEIQDGRPGPQLRLAGGRLADCVAQALRAAGVDPARRRVAVVVGTGLRELRGVEQWHADGAPLRLAQLHFREAVRAAVPEVTEVHTIANACAASGYALALGADILELGDADVVVAAGCDTMTESMLTVIGKVTAGASDMVRPFDEDRPGVLLGEGAAAVVLERPEEVADGRSTLGVLRGVGLTCDAYHETAPDQVGIVAAMRQAHERAGITADDIGLVVAHGTSTGLNDPTEGAALLDVFGPDGPPVTAIKGAIGHTSGGSALMSVLIALTAMRAGTVPPVVGLRSPMPEADRLNLVHGAPLQASPRHAQINAFGFGGVNAVTIVEASDG